MLLRPFFKENESKIYALILFVGTLLLYIPTLWFDFLIYDDPYYVYLNENIKAGIFHPDFYKWFLTANVCALWHPITLFSHALDWQLFGSWAGGHHLTSTLFHTANTLLVFALFSRLTGSSVKSFLVAAIFAWHPIKVESVAWVTQRKDVLSTFFALLSMLVYLRYVKSLNSRKWFILTGSVFLFACSLMCKSTYVTLPITLLLFDFWPLGRKESWFFRGLEKTPFIVLSFLSCLATTHTYTGFVRNYVNYTLIPHAADISRAYWEYLLLFFWPEKLTVLFLDSPNFYIHESLIGGLALAFFTVYLFLHRKTVPFLWVGWCLFIIGLLPVIGIIKIGWEKIACRYLYWSSIGLSICAIWTVETWSSKLKLSKKTLTAITVLILATLISLSSLYLRHWKNSYSIFSQALTIDPQNWRAHFGLQITLLQKGFYEEAAKHRIKAIELGPAYNQDQLREEEKDLGLSWEIFYYMAQEYWRKHDQEQALSYMHKARQQMLESFPSLYASRKTFLDECEESIARNQIQKCEFKISNENSKFIQKP